MRVAKARYKYLEKINTILTYQIYYLVKCIWVAKARYKLLEKINTIFSEKIIVYRHTSVTFFLLFFPRNVSHNPSRHPFAIESSYLTLRTRTRPTFRPCRNHAQTTSRISRLLLFVFSLWFSSTGVLYVISIVFFFFVFLFFFFLSRFLAVLA